MKKGDTLDAGPNPILLRDQDLTNYKDHRQRIEDMQPITKVFNGEHIHKINDSRTLYVEKQRKRSIEIGNQLLDERIRSIMQRKTYSTTNKGVRMFSRPEK